MYLLDANVFMQAKNLHYGEEGEGLSATCIQEIAMELNEQLKTIPVAPSIDRGKRVW